MNGIKLTAHMLHVKKHDFEPLKGTFSCPTSEKKGYAENASEDWICLKSGAG
jgi:hypothetical protein